ncbi:MAG TPA: hypothetical protein VFO12_00250 [Sphingomicrobium sp.]|nr:hypothetical protein [Sphingomicrobium sp.]
MSQETFLFAIQMLAIGLVVVPWWLYRKLRGLPFGDAAPSGKPDAFYWWAVTALWLVFAGVAFLIGRWNGVFLFLGAMAGLALLWASVWTLIQSFGWQRTSSLKSRHLPFGRRFLANYRSALIELPARLVDGL